TLCLRVAIGLYSTVFRIGRRAAAGGRGSLEQPPGEVSPLQSMRTHLILLVEIHSTDDAYDEYACDARHRRGPGDRNRPCLQQRPQALDQPAPTRLRDGACRDPIERIDEAGAASRIARGVVIERLGGGDDDVLAQRVGEVEQGIGIA